MTRPDAHHEPDGVPEPVDGAALDALRQLLRDESVEVDAARREVAIRAALDAAVERPGARAPGAPHRARRPLRPALVAAALIAVVAAGTFALVDGVLPGGGSDELATTGETSQDDGASADPMTALEEGAPGASTLDEPHAAPGGTAGRSTARDGAAPTTTIPSVAGVSGLVDLGDLPDPGAVLDAAAQVVPAGGAGSTTGPTPGADDAAGPTAEPDAPGAPSQEAAVCDSLLVARGWTVRATASVGGIPVLVAYREDGTAVVTETPGCTELERR